MKFPFDAVAYKQGNDSMQYWWDFRGEYPDNPHPPNTAAAESWDLGADDFMAAIEACDDIEPYW